MKPVSEEKRSLRSMLPSGLVSICIHATILAIASFTLRGCEKGAPAQAGGLNYREIGLAVVPSEAAEPSEDRSPAPQDADAEAPSENKPTDRVQDSIPTEAPNIADLLSQNSDSPKDNEKTSESREVIGAGLPAGGLTLTGDGIPELIRPRSASGTGPAGSLTPGPNETSFMNIVGNGQSFVYLIDTSSSMGNSGRLDLAKSQLKSSLRLLKPDQKFQVLFYNYTTSQMKLRNRPDSDMYAATTIQVHLAEDEIDRVFPTGGTEHLNPILHALRLEPDVIYFLTDGDQPRLSRLDLQKIRRNNRSGASIHVIEFASGAKESRDLSWLQLLASQSHGKYSYIPIR